MLTHQVKVKLDRDVNEVVARLSCRDRGAKGALIRRIVMASARDWERSGSTSREEDSDASLASEKAAADVSVKVWFSEDDIRLVSRMAEFDCLTVAQCVRRTVARYVKKLETARQRSNGARSR